ncbi:MAG TPA: hypothetical protein VMV49_12515 [Candidatus Deferrimicrobium sp.]|nr:hypothetical protein [Candidatus Deferrimicrobium sp.]
MTTVEQNYHNQTDRNMAGVFLIFNRKQDGSRCLIHPPHQQSSSEAWWRA